ncbi:MAG: Flp pilus assembly protein CpaB [Chloroflexi bacterium]|nr:Flp pilus assembly protein CpaB [Chloroflexota bacterium]
MIKNQALGGRSNRGLILLGLFLGLVSAVLIVVYLSQAGDGGGGEISGGEVTPVVVASVDIAAGTRIEEGMVETKDITVNTVLAGVFADTEGVIGQVVRVPLVAGEQVITTKVTATGAAIADGENPPLAFVIPEGKRAVSIQVSNVIGASGLIRPGDYVDVILTMAVEQDSIAQTILQNILVLSVDQDVTRALVSEGDEAPVIGGDGSEINPEATTVTLAVSPAHGEVLAVAEACATPRLALALRGFGDSSPVASRTVWAEDGAAPTCAALLGLQS